jgi:TIR domain
MTQIPHAFLCYGFEDTELAKKLALAMMAKGIDTWWANWSIGPGDSLRQKVDEGLGDCTHFIALLTPTSINKPWVNLEMDAGLMRKLEDHAHCRFIPVRYRLPVNQLTPLLRTMYSPEIGDNDFETDIEQLTNDIHGVTRKPPLGEPPAIVSEAANLNTGYSAAASAIAKFFVERTNTAIADSEILITELQEVTGFSEEAVEDALHELSEKVEQYGECVIPRAELYASFDQFWKRWNPEEDARRLAADLYNDKTFPRILPEIAERYGWDARRLNPAVAYLLSHKIVSTYPGMGFQPWLTGEVETTADTRRFVQRRS